MALKRHLLLGLALAAGLSLPAWAAWPERPVRLTVAFPPGSSTDVLTRAVAQRLSEKLGQPFVVENRPGAGGNIGTAAVLRGPADGYNFLVHSTAYAVNPSLYRERAGYDVERDFAAVGMLAITPNVFFVHPSVPANNLTELLALSRTRRMEYGSSGTGTTPHLGAEQLFRALAGVDILHVAFGPAQAVTAVVSNQVPIGSTSLPPALQLIRAGTVRGIALAAPQRHPALPDLPTVAEQGFPGFAASTWFAILAPARTPPAIIDTFNAALLEALASPEMNTVLNAQAFAAQPMPPAETTAFIRAEAARWADVVRTSGATAD